MSYRIYLSNAISMNMFDIEKYALLRIEKYDVEKVKRTIEYAKENGMFISAVGHESTAKVLTAIIGVEIPANRIAIKYEPGDLIIVAQLKSGRIPEGAVLTEEELKNLKFEFYGISAFVYDMIVVNEGR